MRMHHLQQKQSNNLRRRAASRKRGANGLYITQINKKVDPKIEINRRISSTMPVLKRLDLFWKQAQVPTKWKLQVFNALCVSKLLYSLEALQPTEAAANKLDTFQLKVSETKLKMHTTYIDRANTHHEVYRGANLEMGPGAEGTIRPLSEMFQEKRRKVLGQIIRRTTNPQHQATFATRNLLPQVEIRWVRWAAQERSGHMKQKIAGRNTVNK